MSILVPELPTDLVRPQPVQDVPPLEAHLHLDGGPDPGSPPLAVRWIVERYTWRADEPAADRRHRLLPLASGPALDRLDVTGPPGRAGGVTAAWPADITGARRQGGWWLAFTLHTTGTEFMGVRSRKLTVEVVTEDGAVVDERSLPA